MVGVKGTTKTRYGKRYTLYGWKATKASAELLASRHNGPSHIEKKGDGRYWVWVRN